MLRSAVRNLDERSGAAPFLRKTLRYVFPDHWSFLLGEVALYAFVVLVATGVYLTLFFEPSLSRTVYHGSYPPLRGVGMSDAYKSVVDISFNVKAGLLIRQTHHWAADVFVAAIVLHLMRIFFTGAFRKPRELTYLIGLIMLFVTLLEGYLGYSMVDDLLSGMGLAIGYGVALSTPIVGSNLALLLWGSPFPGDHAFESRMYIAHVLLLPMLIATLIGLHLALVASRHHTQFRRVARKQTERKLLGVPTFPGQAPRSLGLLFAVAAVLVLLGGLVQVNPIWQWGPYSVGSGTNGAQPDWYLGWLIGALRMMPSFDLTIGNYTLVPNPFWGGALLPDRRPDRAIDLPVGGAPANRRPRLPQRPRPPARRARQDRVRDGVPQRGLRDPRRGLGRPHLPVPGLELRRADLGVPLRGGAAPGGRLLRDQEDLPLAPADRAARGEPEAGRGGCGARRGAAVRAGDHPVAPSPERLIARRP